MNASNKKEKLKSLDDLVVGQTYHIARNPSLHMSFSGTGVYTHNNNGKIYFDDLIRDERSSATQEVMDSYGSGTFFIYDLNRISEVEIEDRNSFTFVKQDKVDSWDELVRGRHYYIVSDRNCVTSFSGTAQFVRMEGTSVHIYVFRKLVPDKDNSFDLEQIAKVNLKENYYLGQMELFRVYEVTKEIKPTTTPITHSAPSNPDPPMNLEESERMIREIQESYECLPDLD